MTGTGAGNRVPVYETGLWTASIDGGRYKVK
jgi:hypothetical protein